MTERSIRIEHVAIWTEHLERLRDFYTDHLGAAASPEYHNTRTGFRSHFLSWEDGPRLEVMSRPDALGGPADPPRGYAHLALSVGSVEAVDAFVRDLGAAGVPIVDGPRTTGDGYYECVVLDPDGNRVEITT
jgi:lactoylglutathione lyase